MHFVLRGGACGSVFLDFTPKDESHKHHPWGGSKKTKPPKAYSTTNVLGKPAMPNS